MSTESILETAVEAVNSGVGSFFKFISANDSGETDGHQGGFLIPKSAYELFTSQPCVRGDNLKIDISIKWEDGEVTDSVFTYYGRATRNEARITRFGRGSFEYRDRVQTGDLLVLTRTENDTFLAYVLKTEDEIEGFLSAFSLSPIDAGKPISNSDHLIPNEETEFNKIVNQLGQAFPATQFMSDKAREIENKLFNQEDLVIQHPDKKLLNWINMEYRLFRFVESSFFLTTVSKGFEDVDEFVKIANSVLNRRKSRAGKSLENHLKYIFSANKLQFTPQAKTEGRSRPDFIFPSENSYRNLNYPSEKIIFLSSKTTCKDRWRQILNEARRVEVKYLFTLQQGISSQQLQEMEKEKVQLIVPQEYHGTFPKQHQAKILNLSEFITLIKNKTLQ